MGYENCGSVEQYPYDKLFDGKPHIIAADSVNPVRTLRIGAKRRGLRFFQLKIGPRQYMILARVEDDRLSSEDNSRSGGCHFRLSLHISARGNN